VSDLDRRLEALEARQQRQTVPQAVQDRFGPYRDNPVGFVGDVLGAESATRRSNGEPYQFSVLGDLVEHPRVAVRSGHGVGKTAIDAWAALWWLLTRPFSRVLVLAPEFARQVRAIVFSEIRRWARRSRVALPVEVLANRVLVAGHGEEWSATGMSAAGESDRLEGFHAPGGVLLICDETKGIPQESFDAVQGALSGLEDSRLLVTSVPGGAGAGPFWKACEDAGRWVVHHLPSTDSSLVSSQWVADRAKDWGEGSPLYECRVLGRFADAGEGVLFPLPLLEAATSRVLVVPEDASLALGVDVARSVAGDQNAIAVMRGGRLERLVLWRSPDTMQTVQRVLAVVAETGAQQLAVDVGGPGGGVVDRLRQLGRTVDGVAFGSAATDPTRFVNRRSELYWGVREGLEKGTLALPDDDELVADLSAIRYAFDQRGRIALESKDDVRARLGRSPDRADAVVLAVWAAIGGGWDAGRGWIEFMKQEVLRTGAPLPASASAADRDAAGQRTVARILEPVADAPAAPAPVSAHLGQLLSADPYAVPIVPQHLHTCSRCGHPTVGTPPPVCPSCGLTP